MNTALELNLNLEVNMDVNIIKSLKEIRTPLSFLALAIIMTEALLYSLIESETDAHKTIITVGMVALPFVIIWVFYLLSREQSNGYEGAELKVDEENKELGNMYDLFVSVPMASFNESHEYEKFRESILDAIRGIKKSCSFNDVFLLVKKLVRLRILTLRIYLL